MNLANLQTLSNSLKQNLSIKFIYLIYIFLFICFREMKITYLQKEILTN